MPKALLLCMMALGFGVCFGWSLSVPDTIQLPDSLGPLRPGYHLAFGSSTNNIYVASESSDIIVVDGSHGGTFQRIKRINTGTPVGGALLVSQHNRLYCSYPRQGRIGVIDCATNSVVRTIDVGTRPTLLCYSSGSDKLYCGDTIDCTVSVINCATNAVLKIIPIGDSLTAMAYDPTSSKVYAATRDAVRAISCSADSIVASIDEVKGARGLCVNKRRQKLYAVKWQNNTFHDTVYVISTQTDTVVSAMDCGWNPLPRLACNEATDRLYAAVNGDGNISEFDCVGDTLVRLGPLIYYSVGLVCDSVRNRLYNLCQDNDAGRLLVLDCATFLFISWTPVGSEPAILQADPSRYRMMCANRRAEASVLTVFDYKGDSSYARGAVPLCGWTQFMCHNPATGRLYCSWEAGVGGGVAVIDEQTNRVVVQAFLPGSWGEMPYSPTSSKFYFEVGYGSFIDRRGLGVMDGSGDSLLKVIEMGDDHGQAFPCWCPDGNKIYCNAVVGPRWYIAVVDCYSDSVVREIDVYDHVQGFEYLGEGRMLCILREALALIDCRTDSVVVDSALDEPVYAVAHTGDGEKVYLARRGRLEVRSSSSLSLLSTIDWPYFDPVNLMATFLAYSDTTRKLYWFAGDSVSAIDGISDTVTARLKNSPWGNGACLDRTGRYLFCTSRLDSTLRVYDTQTDSLLGVYTQLPYPVAIAASPEYRSIYVGCSDVILVYPEAPPGVEETPNGEERAPSFGPTVVRGMLLLNGLGTRSELPDNSVMSRAALMDASGRKVMDLRPGANDVRALVPGVYFLRRPKTEDGRPDAAVRKIVIAR